MNVVNRILGCIGNEELEHFIYPYSTACPVTLIFNVAHVFSTTKKTPLTVLILYGIMNKKKVTRWRLVTFFKYKQYFKE